MSEWFATDLDLPTKFKDGSKVYKHGAGCAVHFVGRTVDFDFGDAGEIDGFNCNRLKSFAGNRLGDFDFVSESEIQDAFAFAVQAGDIVDRGEVNCFLKGGTQAADGSSLKTATVFTNTDTMPIRLIVEPWGGGVQIRPGESIELVVSNPETLPTIELELQLGRLVVVVRDGGSVYEIWQNGVRID